MKRDERMMLVVSKSKFGNNSIKVKENIKKDVKQNDENDKELDSN